MPRLVIKTKKKRPLTRELSRLKEQLRRLTEQLTSRDRELAEAFDHPAGHQRWLQHDRRYRNQLTIGDGCHCPERRGIVRCSRRRGVAGRRQGQARRCTLWIDPMRQVQEEDDEIDRVFTLAAPCSTAKRRSLPKSLGRIEACDG